ncbi:MAG: hypothetical protein MJ092_00330 [Lachnospiraceae bacterium]|nr:hypothetical protein [Lachnospiraceae bacterium]
MSEIIVITYPSALDFWLDGTYQFSDQYPYAYRKLADIPNDFASPISKEIVQELSFCLGLNSPISFLVSSERNRKKSALYQKISRPKHLPPKSFIKIDSRIIPALDKYEIFMASPEYCFLCAVKDHSLGQLVEIGTNLCAMYVKDLECSALQHPRQPLITQNLLSKYVAAACNMPYHRKAMVAVKYVVDNSRSPMESKLATICCLPRKNGGYGIKPPKLNYDIAHSIDSKGIFERNSSNCDFVWPKERIVLEYDSDMFHANPEQFAYDKIKYRALTISDYKVFPIVKKDIQSLDQLDHFFLLVRSKLGMRNQLSEFKHFRYQREIVYNDLFRSFSK